MIVPLLSSPQVAELRGLLQDSAAASDARVAAAQEDGVAAAATALRAALHSAGLQIGAGSGGSGQVGGQGGQPREAALPSLLVEVGCGRLP